MLRRGIELFLSLISSDLKSSLPCAWMSMEGPLLRPEFIPDVPGSPGQRFCHGGGGRGQGVEGRGKMERREVLPFAHVWSALSVPMHPPGGHALMTTALLWRVTVTIALWAPSLRRASGEEGPASLSRDGFREYPMQIEWLSTYVRFWAASPKLSLIFKPTVTYRKVKNHGVLISVFHWETQSSPRTTRI